ncbi:hypothetical protein LDK45_14045, partial [Lactiplantibacillus plantarum]|uniref:hypothetical protein n=1 Tax=Lactiplantibacillus plantarum TaxID=1590 RepID=UPI0022372267
FRRVSGATDALFLFSIISKTGLEKSEDFSRPVLFLETYVTASSNNLKFIYNTYGNFIENFSDFFTSISNKRQIMSRFDN